MLENGETIHIFGVSPLWKFVSYTKLIPVSPEDAAIWWLVCEYEDPWQGYATL
jgi:hypothetical protein